MGGSVTKTTSHEDDKANGIEDQTSANPLLATYGVNTTSGHGRLTNTSLGLSLDFAANVIGESMDQDRFVLCPKLFDSLYFSAVFDGHGKYGENRAQRAAEILPRLISEHILNECEDTEEGNKSCNPTMNELKEAMTSCFERLQSEMDADYEVEILAPAAELKKQIENDSKVDLGPLQLPQDGGTTAAIVCVLEKSMLIASVGDSRIVMGIRKDGKIVSEALTEDHNVSNASPEEIKRIEGAGGSVSEKHLGISNAEGMLQLTRSLGDAPFHRGGVVLHQPVLKEHEINENCMFVISASDGLWDHFTNTEAVEYVETKLNDLKGKNESSLHEGLYEIVKTLEEDALKKAKETGTRADDISVIIAVFPGFWNTSV